MMPIADSKLTFLILLKLADKLGAAARIFVYKRKAQE